MCGNVFTRAEAFGATSFVCAACRRKAYMKRETKFDRAAIAEKCRAKAEMKKAEARLALRKKEQAEAIKKNEELFLNKIYGT